MLFLFSIFYLLIHFTQSYSNCLTLFRSNTLNPSNILKYNKEKYVKINPLKSTITIPTSYSAQVDIHGMEERLPWKTSINIEKTLSYMPMLEKQLHIIKNLGLREDKIETVREHERDQNVEKKVRGD